jgi:sulfite reductase alpha subunit-like flavoprotein
MEGESSLFSQSKSDKQRRAYVQDVFEGSSDMVTRWVSEQVTACCIEINGVESHLLDGMK